MPRFDCFKPAKCRKPRDRHDCTPSWKKPRKHRCKPHHDRTSCKPRPDRCH